jgi:glucose/arabinose dehydrogenase
MFLGRALVLLSLTLPITCVAASSPDVPPDSGATAFIAYNTTTAANAPDLQPVGIGDHTLWAPPGVSVRVIASGLNAPRFMAFDSAGNLLVADMGAGALYRYTSLDQSTAPSAPLLKGLDAPSNVALWGGYLYVGETTTVSRYTYDASSGDIGAREVVVPNLPSGGHSTRTITFGPDASMYVSVGSSCNICDESDARRAAILRFNPDASGYVRFAWGLRNAVGLAIQPSTGQLWATVNERDNQGNDIPPDLVTLVQEGQNFGWPSCQPPTATPQSQGADCSGITPPTIGIQAHSAPLGLAFSGDDLVVAQHGSWNRDPPAEPKLLRIHFNPGDALPSSASDFIKGWQDAAGNRWGRPAGVAVAPDGSLIVSDDQAGLLYQIRTIAP